jgi:hypothetical protein
VFSTTTDFQSDVPIFVDARGRQHVLPLGSYTGAAPVLINNRGDIVGYAYDTSAVDWVIWPRRAAPQRIGPAEFNNFAIAMNDRREILFGQSDAEVYRNGEFHPLAQPGQTRTFAYDMNESGVVVGVARTATSLWEGFAWTRRQGQVKLGPPANGRSRCGVKIGEITCAGNVRG